MPRTWSKRLFLSYVPVFLITVGVIVLVAISMLSEISVKETQKANRIFTGYVMDSMDTSLRGIERLILEEMNHNQRFTEFFEAGGGEADRFLHFEVSKEFRKIKNENPMIHSIYFYRAKDDLVITENTVEKLGNFHDQSFVRQMLERAPDRHWSPPRLYSDLSLQSEYRVVSISKRALLPFGSQGIVVVNVEVESLLGIVDQMINSEITFMEIRSHEGHLIYPRAAEEGDAAGESSRGTAVSRLSSDYLHLTFVSGIKSGAMFAWIKLISHIWLGIAIATVLAGTVYMIHVTRKNYRPIQAIMEQIQSFQHRSMSKGKDGDEFSFIGKVLENLMEQSVHYEKQHREDLIVRRRQLFQELIEGKSNVTQETWKLHMERFQMPRRFSRLIAAVVEVDQYRSFQSRYTEEDQQLLKFALTNVANEFYTGSNHYAWCEWISAKRLAILFLYGDEETFEPEPLSETMEQFRTWVAVNLKFSVTVGIGPAVSEIRGISASFQKALNALSYKMALGNNQVISFSELMGEPAPDIHRYIQQINKLVEDFRFCGPAWVHQAEQLALNLEKDLLRDEDLHYLIQYLTSLFSRSMGDYPPETAGYWLEQVRPGLLGVLEEAETLEEALPVVTGSLKRLHEHHVSVRELKNQKHLMNDIRVYIEENFANPDLSLNHLSDKFGVNAKYSSQLFKAEFGMKFVDFLVNLRMERAKKLLLETEESINDISLMVGYNHPISFGRTFKKTVGVTPGDYRKYIRDKP